MLFNRKSYASFEGAKFNGKKEVRGTFNKLLEYLCDEYDRILRRFSCLISTFTSPVLLLLPSAKSKAQSNVNTKIRIISLLCSLETVVEENISSYKFSLEEKPKFY